MENFKKELEAYVNDSIQRNIDTFEKEDFHIEIIDLPNGECAKTSELNEGARNNYKESVIENLITEDDEWFDFINTINNKACEEVYLWMVENYANLDGLEEMHQRNRIHLFKGGKV